MNEVENNAVDRTGLGLEAGLRAVYLDPAMEQALKELRYRQSASKGDLIRRALATARLSDVVSDNGPVRVIDFEGRTVSLGKVLPFERRRKPASTLEAREHARFAALFADLNALSGLGPQERGYAFERYLIRLLGEFDLAPREPFRNEGEQIDGSFVLDHHVYLLEAKWTKKLIGVADLRAFEGKLEKKAVWTRGLFISDRGFSKPGLKALGRGSRMICLDGRDLRVALERQISFAELLRAKVRHAAETGEPFAPVEKLFR